MKEFERWEYKVTYFLLNETKIIKIIRSYSSNNINELKIRLYVQIFKTGAWPTPLRQWLMVDPVVLLRDKESILIEKQRSHFGVNNTN